MTGVLGTITLTGKFSTYLIGFGWKLAVAAAGMSFIAAILPCIDTALSHRIDNKQDKEDKQDEKVSHQGQKSVLH